MVRTALSREPWRHGQALRATKEWVWLAPTHWGRGLLAPRVAARRVPGRRGDGVEWNTAGRGKNKATADDLRECSRESVVFGDDVDVLLLMHRKGCVEEMWWKARRSLGTVRQLVSATTTDT